MRAIVSVVSLATLVVVLTGACTVSMPAGANKRQTELVSPSASSSPNADLGGPVGLWPAN